MSSPASSSDSVTRRPYVFLMIQNVRNDAGKTNENAIVNPMACAASCVKLPEYHSPPCGSPNALYCARRGAVKRPHDTVPQIPGMPWADSAPNETLLDLSS